MAKIEDGFSTAQRKSFYSIMRLARLAWASERAYELVQHIATWHIAYNPEWQVTDEGITLFWTGAKNKRLSVDLVLDKPIVLTCTFWYDYEASNALHGGVPDDHFYIDRDYLHAPNAYAPLRELLAEHFAIDTTARKE